MFFPISDKSFTIIQNDPPHGCNIINPTQNTILQNKIILRKKNNANTILYYYFTIMTLSAHLAKEGVKKMVPSGRRHCIYLLYTEKIEKMLKFYRFTSSTDIIICKVYLTPI